MLYFLVFLLPFCIVMWYLINQNNKLKKSYTDIYEKLWNQAIGLPVELQRRKKDNLDAIITGDSVKILESDILQLENYFELDKNAVISNKYLPRKKKLSILKKRINNIISLPLETVEG